MGDGDQKPLGNCNRHNHVGTHIYNPPPQHWELPSLRRAVVFRRSLHTQRSLAQLLLCTTCVKLCHMSVQLLQLWPIQVGFLWFRAIHVGIPQLQIENWTVGISIWLSGLCAFVLTSGLGIWDFAHVPYLCSIVCSTFGFWTPSFLDVFVIVNHVYTAHLFIKWCRSYDLASIVCCPAPSILTQHCGLSNLAPPIVPLA